MKDFAEIDSRRLFRQVRRQGALTVTRRVSEEIRKGEVHVYLAYRLSNYLMKHGEFSCAGKLLRTARRYGKASVLIDHLYGEWLWSTGDRNGAMRFVAKKAKLWSVVHLFGLLAIMKEFVGNHRLAKKYRDIADLLAEKESTPN